MSNTPHAYRYFYGFDGPHGDEQRATRWARCESRADAVRYAVDELIQSSAPDPTPCQIQIAPMRPPSSDEVRATFGYESDQFSHRLREKLMYKCERGVWLPAALAGPPEPARRLIEAAVREWVREAGILAVDIERIETGPHDAAVALRDRLRELAEEAAIQRDEDGWRP